ncbi:type II toxin-antitoxin system RelB/DinJ family antitoxin [Hominisplanchenecus murintestinalis]|uniref:Type II toxin-antitoxin system RelB/DinJ family antitoxin n=1 Tax=Hominisplanchenecus murintestinalis TaxID=2941517 RepID=A0AC61QUN5_9FIRM|nr:MULTISPECIES: type II toxin-antitoxin system RelB/DinJ family antitoxin [Clostridia]EOT28770.1 RelB/DinJ family addiction module antitoxin [Eubacterium sp. 14-2]MCI8711711.1 type II toxin-antitoxin system RelB/DinJ family antitoxin [Ruminococcus sp.]TGX96128.1 type II toxin-antitoxin system RelB/DinJ family antitoxin [Hominisplanchenecus murintestinalis]
MAARSANVNVRVEPDVKKQAEDILEKLGVSTSAFINMTYRQVIMKRGIPFSVELPSGIKTLDTMTDAEFDEMMQTGLEQAKKGESVPYEEAFDRLMEGL